MVAAPAARRMALVAICLTSLLTPFMSSAINIALPAIGSEFGMEAVPQAWVGTIYTLAVAVMMVPFGKLADIHGRKRVYLWGVVIYTLSSLACALAGSGVSLIVWRAAQGVGAAMVFATGIAILTSIYPPDQRGQVLGITTAVTYAGLSVGPFLGGLLVGQWGWRSVFWVNVPLGALTLAFVLGRLTGEWAGSPGDAFDGLGALIYGAAVVAVMVGFSYLPALWAAALVAAGLLAAAGFVRHEGRTALPVLDLSLFRGNRVFTLSGLAALVSYWATSSVTMLLSLYLQYIQGMSPREAGAALIVQPVLMAVLSPLAGRLSDHTEPRILASVGMAWCVMGLAGLAFLSEGTSLAYVMGCQVALGIGFALFSTPNTSAIMGAVQPRFYGLASGMVGTMRSFGQMLSMTVAMLLFSLLIGPVQITPQHYGAFLASVRLNFLLSALLCAAGVAASLARGSLRAPVGDGRRSS